MNEPGGNPGGGNGRVGLETRSSAAAIPSFSSRDEMLTNLLALAAGETGTTSAFFAQPVSDTHWLIVAAHNEPGGCNISIGATVDSVDQQTAAGELQICGAAIGRSMSLILCDESLTNRGLIGVADPTAGVFPADAAKSLARIARILNTYLDLDRQTTVLLDSNNWQRTIIDSTAEGILLRSADGSIGAVNRSAEALLGVPADQLIGRISLPIRYVVVGDDGQYLVDTSTPGLSTLHTGEPLNNVLIGIDRPDGASIWVSVNSRPLIAPGESKPYAAVVSFNDVTERLRAIEALRASEERFKSLSAASPLGIFHTDSDGTILYVNTRSEEIAGRSSDDLLGLTLIDVFASPVDSTFADWRQIATDKGAFEQELLITPPGGSAHWINLCAAPLGGGAGLAAGFVGTVEDIDSRKLAETESHERQVRLTILNSIATEISAGMSVDQIIDRAVQRLAEHFPDHRVIYGMIDGDRQLSIIRSFQPPEMTSLVGKQRDLAAVPDFFQALRAGSIAVDDVEHDERVVAVADRILAGGARAFLDVLLRIGDEDVALLGLDSTEPHRWTSHEIAMLSDVGGYLAVAISHARSDEESRRASLEAQRTAGRFQSMVQHSSDIISVFDSQTDRTYISPSVERILGYTVAEMLPKSQAQITHPDDLPAIERAFATMRARPGESITTRFRLRHKDGSWRWMESVATNFLDDPAVRGFVSNTRDITERRRAEDALRESELRFRNAFEHALAGMALTDHQGRFLWVNESLCRLLGFAADELLAASFIDIIHPDDLEEARADSAKLFSGEHHSYQRERRFLRKDERVIWGLLSASILFDADDRPVRVIGQVQDITQRRQAAAALEEANARLEELNQAKSDFVSLVSHEFRTPLTGIRGFSELIRDEALSVAEMKEFANDINADAQRLARLIDELLDLERMQSGRIVLNRTDVDLNGVIHHVAQHFRTASASHHIHMTLADALPVISGDRDKLIQVVTNLLGNAIKYSPDGGVVTIRSRLEQNSIALDVSDQGVGIPSDDLERIFDRYARVESGASRFIKGIGLGLPISRQIVELHGGKIWAESTPGKDSTFHVVIPVSAPMEV